MLIAGPCAVQSRKQAFRIARYVKSNGATIFRGGAWKGQNRPFPNGEPAYWGLGREAVEILADIQAQIKIPCVTEVQSVDHAEFAVDLGLEYLQIGARHMQNFPLLRWIEKHTKNQVLLKRGLGNTVDEWIGAAEHLGGPERVIMCERGVANFDRTVDTRWRLDFVGVAYLKLFTDYRVVMDVSHGTGDRKLAVALSKPALETADGLVVEVHYAPDRSPTDAKQTVNFAQFKKIGGYYAERLLHKK